MKLSDSARRLSRMVAAATAIVALVVLAFSSTVPWGNLDVNTKIGIIPVSLKADVFEYGINYDANLSSAGLLSGIKMPSNISDKKLFLTGLGGFQETIGFVKGTSKEKVIYATSYTWPPPQNGTADTRITTMVNTIPWWPVGLAQDVGVSVEMISAVNVSELVVQKVTFELHRTINGEDRYKVAYEASPGASLTKVGDKKAFWGKVTPDDDWGEFSVVARVQLELKDKFGNSNKVSDGVYRELAPPPKEVKLWTMSTDKTVRVGLMVAAFPISIAAMVLLAVGAVTGLLGEGRQRVGRWAWKVCAAASVLALLSVVFYVMGINALIELTGYIDWFKWNPYFFAAAAGACLSVVAAVLLFMVRPPPAPGKKGTAGSI
jgi:hypothetical protein